MARPRIRQFAGDMGISYDEAKNLIEKGRGRRDGGSQVLESNMNKMRGYEKGGTKKMMKPTPLTPRQKAYRKFMGSDAAEDIKDAVRKNPRLLDPDHPMNKEGREDEVRAKDGKYMCRGGGKAIQGTKFTGVK